MLWHVSRPTPEETEDAWVLEAEPPGVSQEDINLELREGELVISEASLDKGVLTVGVPKSPRAEPKRIEVKARG